MHIYNVHIKTPPDMFSLACACMVHVLARPAALRLLALRQTHRSAYAQQNVAWHKFTHPPASCHKAYGALRLSSTPERSSLAIRRAKKKNKFTQYKTCTCNHCCPADTPPERKANLTTTRRDGLMCCIGLVSLSPPYAPPGSIELLMTARANGQRVETHQDARCTTI